jgi:hypothetical protein
VIRYLKNIIIDRVFAKLYNSTWSNYSQATKSTEELSKRYPEIRFSEATPLCEIMTQAGSDKGNAVEEDAIMLRCTLHFLQV